MIKQFENLICKIALSYKFYQRESSNILWQNSFLIYQRTENMVFPGN